MFSQNKKGPTHTHKGRRILAYYYIILNRQDIFDTFVFVRRRYLAHLSTSPGDNPNLNNPKKVRNKVSSRGYNGRMKTFFCMYINKCL